MAVYKRLPATMSLLMFFSAASTLQAAQPPVAGDLPAAREEVLENPRNVEAQLELARAALTAREPEEALRAAATARSLAPHDTRVLPLLAEAQIQAGRLEEAVSTYESMPEEVRTASGLGGTIEGIRRMRQAEELLQAATDEAGTATYEQAAELLADAVQAAPSLLELRKSLGFIYLDKLQQPERALPHLEAAAEVAPADSEGAALLGRALLELGRFARSAEIFRQLVTENPEDAPSRLNLAEALIGLGEREQAERILLEALQDEPDSERAQKLLAEARRPSETGSATADDLQTSQARALLREANDLVAEADRSGNMGGYRVAVQRLQQALQIEPNSYTLHRTLGFILLEKLAQPCLAYRELSRALAIRPNDLETLKLLAVASLRVGNHCEAIQLFRAVLRRDPTDLWMQVNLGRAWAQAGEYDCAVAIYRSVLARDPGNFTARLGIAEVLAWQGLTERPLAITDRLVCEQPRSSEVHNLRGDLYRWDWDFASARAEYLRARASDPAGRAGIEGMREIEDALSVVASSDGYQFEDNFGFRRGFIGGSVRVPLTDKAYLIPRAVAWDFEQGAISMSRTDAILDLEYHFDRQLQTTFRFLNYDYSNHDAEQAGILSLRYSPTAALDLYASASGNEPAVLTDINIPLFNVRMNSYAAGFDADLSNRWSTQGTYSYGDYSDGNERRFGSAQLSYQVFPCHDVFLRAEYEGLSFADQTPLYFSPDSFDLLRLSTDFSVPLFGNVDLDGEAEAIHVLGEGWGRAYRLGPSWQIDDQVALRAAYFNTSIPGATPFSGDGFDFFASYRF